MIRGSLRLRLLLAGAIAVVAALALAGFGMTTLFQRHVERRVRAELDGYLSRVVAGLDRNAAGELFVTRPPSDPRFAAPLAGLYWQVQAGETVLRSRSLWDSRLALPQQQPKAGAIQRDRLTGPNGEALLGIERSLTLPTRLGSDPIRVAVAIDRADIVQATHDFAVDLLPYLGVLAAVLIAAGCAQVIIGLHPLSAVRSRLAAIRAGDARRLGQAFPDEILPLATEVDALLAAREAQIEKARARAGDLAHGLRTPLQVLAGDVERLRARGEVEIAAEIEQVATTMQRHVDHELARARLAAGRGDATTLVDAVVRRIAAVLTRTPEGSRLDWTLAVPEGTTARIDPDDLAEAIGNLGENAVRHARHAVRIACRCDGGMTIVSVADDGPGIPEMQQSMMLARGSRRDQSGSGAGLGLAIVTDIAEAWGGRLVLHSSEAGLQADFCIPATGATVPPSGET